MGSRLNRVKRYFELGRVFSAMLTAGAAILGAYAVGIEVEWWQILIFMAVGFFSHAFGCALNEICDYELDKKVPEISHKPLIKGDITMVQAFSFTLVCLFASYTLVIWFFPHMPTLIFFTLANIFAAAYSFKAKYTPWAYDFTLGAGLFFYTLYGAAAVGEFDLLRDVLNFPMVMVAALIIFLFEVFIQWGNAVKDVETDRLLKVPTRAVVWGYKHEDNLGIRDPNLVYGVIIKLFLITMFIIPFFLDSIGVVDFGFSNYLIGLPLYFVFFIILGIPAQLYSIYTMLGRHTRSSYINFIVKDGVLTWLACPFLVVDTIGVLGAIGLFFLPFIWFLFIKTILYKTPMRPGL
ncbi:MAG: UbiA prenyltransferase family protein [Methanomassiliicoccales archaeon]|nr:MAG: UbiA prenyltransferase family protein [Methanomassiliicoccales archaeon]